MTQHDYRARLQHMLDHSREAVQLAERRQRAIAIGEKIGLYKDWPVRKGCTIPYVPVWVDAMVKRNG